MASKITSLLPTFNALTLDKAKEWLLYPEKAPCAFHKIADRQFGFILVLERSLEETPSAWQADAHKKALKWKCAAVRNERAALTQLWSGIQGSGPFDLNKAIALVIPAGVVFYAGASVFDPEEKDWIPNIWWETWDQIKV